MQRIDKLYTVWLVFILYSTVIFCQLTNRLAIDKKIHFQGIKTVYATPQDADHNLENPIIISSTLPL
jgi:hypothetical protein